MQCRFELSSKTFVFEIAEDFSNEEEPEVRTQLIRKFAQECFDDMGRFTQFTIISPGTELRVPMLDRVFHITSATVEN